MKRRLKKRGMALVSGSALTLYGLPCLSGAMGREALTLRRPIANLLISSVPASAVHIVGKVKGDLTRFKRVMREREVVLEAV
jgi:hypothetical protein